MAYLEAPRDGEDVIFLDTEPKRMIAKFTYPSTGANYLINLNHIDYPESELPDNADIADFIRDIVREMEYVLGCVHNRRVQRQTEEQLLEAVEALTIPTSNAGETTYLNTILTLLETRYLVQCNAYFGLFEPGGQVLRFVSATEGSSMKGRTLLKELNEGVSYGCSEAKTSIVVNDLEKRYIQQLQWTKGVQMSPKTDDDTLFPPAEMIQYRRGFSLRKALHKFFEARVSDATGHFQFLCDTVSPLIIWHRGHKDVKVLISQVLDKLHDDPLRWKLKRRCPPICSSNFPTMPLLFQNTRNRFTPIYLGHFSLFLT